MRIVRFAVGTVALVALFALSASAGDAAIAGAPDAVPQGANPPYRYDWNNDNCSDFMDITGSGLRLFKGDCSGQIYSYNDPTFMGLDGEQFLLPGDWDDDGCADMFIIIGAKLYLALGDCNAAFKTTSPALIGDYPAFDYWVAPGNWTNDTDPDLMARQAITGDFFLLKGNGRDGFSGDPTQIGNGFGIFNWIMGVGYFDADGCADVAGRRMDDPNSLRLYPGDCNGSFKPTQNISFGVGTNWAQYDWFFTGGNWGFGIGTNCPDIAAWKVGDPASLAFFHGNCTGDLTGVAISANFPGGFWNAPFAGDGTTLKMWGDGDCNHAVAPRDAQANLKVFLSQTPISQQPGCISLGNFVIVNGEEQTFGDWDCNGAIAPRDGQALLAHFLQQPELTQIEPCPDLGEGVIYGFS